MFQSVKLAQLPDEYFKATGLSNEPGSLLFPAALGKTGKLLSRRPLVRTDAAEIRPPDESSLCYERKAIGTGILAQGLPWVNFPPELALKGPPGTARIGSGPLNRRAQSAEGKDEG